MASSSADGFITLMCTNINPIGADVAKDGEILILTKDIQSWDLDTILRHQTVKVHAPRDRLAEQSSYFRSLLSGSFSESSLDSISIQWNLETFISILKCIHGSPVDVTSYNFLPLFEGALYFGVEMLIFKCRTWFSDVYLAKGCQPQKVQLEDLINIWHFGLEHANNFVPELCVRYLAQNFMWAMSQKHFVNIPYNWLLDSIKHPYLTVDSEMRLFDALFIWISANIEPLDLSGRREDHLNAILKEIRISILPLWFAAGKRRSFNFSKLADESVKSILSLVKIYPVSLTDVLYDIELKHLRIRLTEYSEKVNLSSCPQMTSAILFLSVLDSSYYMDPMSTKILKHFDKDQCRIPPSLLPTLSFKAVQEVDISKCPALHLQSAIECFSKSFPSLRTIKAAYLLNFNMTILCKLLLKCPLLCEVDLTVDPSPVTPKQVSVVSSSRSPMVSNKSIVCDSSLFPTSVYHSGPLLWSITKLTLEGRSEVCDPDLEFVLERCVSLGYLNLKGCISLTDVGISNFIRRCSKLHSILVCGTSFGLNSIQALSSKIPNCNSPASHGNGHFYSMASNLQMLHMGSCKGVDATDLLELMSLARMLKSLCLRGTHLVDNALYTFSGSSLELLDVSDTMISGAALAHIVRGNSGLKYLYARGCKNLIQQESNTRGVEISSLYSCGELFTELGRTCILREIALGWGFSYLSLQALKPAIKLLQSITVGLGGSLGEDALRLLPTTCPMLESVVLHFQVISDSIMISVMASLRKLQALTLSYCLGDISISSFQLALPNLRKLKLERVTPWMTNNDLLILTQNFPNLVELSLLGCALLDTDSQAIISQGWPGLISLHIEECGNITVDGVSSLFNCIAIEDLLLRHNGPGIDRNFVLDTASKMPMLRQISLDLCDANAGDFEIPDYENKYFLSILRIARCKSKRCSLNHNSLETCRQAVHKESLVLVWNCKKLTRTVVKERL